MPFDGVSPKSIVILDNASIHHVDCVVDTIQSVIPASILTRHEYNRGSLCRNQTVFTSSIYKPMTVSFKPHHVLEP